MTDRYIPKIGDWFNAYIITPSGKKHKHFMCPLQCNKILYQTHEGKKHPIKIETKDFRFECRNWNFEKVERGNQ